MHRKRAPKICNGLCRSKQSICYQPSHVGHQQGSFLPVLLSPIEGDQVWFRSKRQLYPLIKEWRSAGSCSRADTLPERPSLGLHCRILLSREGDRVLAVWVQLCRSQLQTAVPGASSLHTAHCHRLELRCHAQHFCTQPMQLFCTRSSGLKCQVRGLCTQHPMSK